MTRDAAPAPAGRPVRGGPRRADLPDLGADLRVQPRLRPLPVELGPPRPARADDRRVQGGHRRAPADAGLLRQHRRRRADRPPRLLGAPRLRDRARRRREVLDQRLAGSRPSVAARLAASDYVDVQISLDGATAEVNDAVRGPGSYATALRAMEHLADAGFAGFKLSVVVTRQNVGAARRVQGASPTATARSCGSRGCGRPAAAPTSGTSCIRPRRSSASCTTGCSRTARRC